MDTVYIVPEAVLIALPHRMDIVSPCWYFFDDENLTYFVHSLRMN